MLDGKPMAAWRLGRPLGSRLALIDPVLVSPGTYAAGSCLGSAVCVLHVFIHSCDTRGHSRNTRWQSHQKAKCPRLYLKSSTDSNQPPPRRPPTIQCHDPPHRSAATRGRDGAAACRVNGAEASRTATGPAPPHAVRAVPWIGLRPARVRPEAN